MAKRMRKMDISKLDITNPKDMKKIEKEMFESVYKRLMKMDGFVEMAKNANV